MSIEKVLHKLQESVAELIDDLENFTDQTVQPSVEECDNLKTKIAELQETLAVYKHFKINKEISPSFNIHAKINEAEPIIERINEKEILPLVELQFNHNIIEEEQENEDQIKDKSASSETIFRAKSLSIAINDKFKYVNELFSKNASEYSIAVEQINNLNNWHECEIYLNSLKSLYNWNAHNETVKHLYHQVKKRFD